jgi:thiamine pyrophosphokinase
MPKFNISKPVEIEITSGLKYKLYARKLKPQTAFSVSNCFVMRNN